MNIEKLYGEQKDNLWGGRRLIDKYGKESCGEILAESWELSFHKDGPTKLSDSRTLMEAVSSCELGKNVADFSDFPMMIKLIDAKENLSVQVHPDDDYAMKHEASYGKTEMWYIVEADEGAGIYLGFNRDLQKEELLNAIKENTLTDIMNFIPVSKGDCYLIPAGTIHAIGAGCLIYEIQQSSNITYRVYDYGRVDKNGKQRELHVDKALDVLKLEKYVKNSLCADVLGISKYFTLEKKVINGENVKISPDACSFRCITVIDGCGTLNSVPVSQGDSYFVCATEKEVILNGDMTVLVASLRKYGVGTETVNGVARAYIYNDLSDRIIEAVGDDETAAKKKVMGLANLTENDITI